MKLFLLILSISCFSYASMMEKRHNSYLLIKKTCDELSIIKINNQYRCGKVLFSYDKFNTLSIFIEGELYHQEYHNRYSYSPSVALGMINLLDRIYKGKKDSLDWKVEKIIKKIPN